MRITYPTIQSCCGLVGWCVDQPTQQYCLGQHSLVLPSIGCWSGVQSQNRALRPRPVYSPSTKPSPMQRSLESRNSEKRPNEINQRELQINSTRLALLCRTQLRQSHTQGLLVGTLIYFANVMRRLKECIPNGAPHFSPQQPLCQSFSSHDSDLEACWRAIRTSLPEFICTSPRVNVLWTDGDFLCTAQNGWLCDYCQSWFINWDTPSWGYTQTNKCIIEYQASDVNKKGTNWTFLHRLYTRHVPWMGFLNSASALKQYFILLLNGSKNYLKYTFKAVHVLGIWTPAHLYLYTLTTTNSKVLPTKHREQKEKGRKKEPLYRCLWWHDEFTSGSSIVIDALQWLKFIPCCGVHQHFPTCRIALVGYHLRTKSAPFITIQKVHNSLGNIYVCITERLYKHNHQCWRSPFMYQDTFPGCISDMYQNGTESKSCDAVVVLKKSN